VQTSSCALRDLTKEYCDVDMREINEGIITEFRANAGELSGPMAGAPILLLTTAGRISGDAHTTPVGFIDANGRLAAAAANGGSDQHPDWYRNIEADSQVTIEVPGATIRSKAVVATGAERTQLLDQLSAALPGMADHVAGTTRHIPVVIFNEPS